MVRLLCLLALLGGCKRAAPPQEAPRIVGVQVVDRTPEPFRVPLDLKALEARAGRVAAEASGMAVAEGGEAGKRYKLKVEIRTEAGEDAQAKKGLMRAMVSARLQPVGAEIGALAFEQSGVAERVYDLGPADGGATDDAWRAHVGRLLEDVVRAAGARARLSTADAAALVAAIEGKDEDLREEATRLAAERKERAAVPALVKLLKHEDAAVRDRAIGALHAIGDRRAVKPLTEVARFRDLGELPKVLAAVAAIGGDEARAYLEFVASGHENAEMRELAKKSLDRLARREAQRADRAR